MSTRVQAEESVARVHELAGFDVHLVKPVAPAELLDTVRRVAGG